MRRAQGRGGDPAADDADAGGPTGDSDSEGGNCQFAPEHPTPLVGAEQFPERMQGGDNCGNNERADVDTGFQVDPDRIPECTDTERFAQRTDSSLYGDGEYTDATDADVTEGGFSDADVTEHADIGIITDAETEDEDFIRGRYSERSGAPGEHPEEPTPNTDTGYYTGGTDGGETTGPIGIDGNIINLGDNFEAGCADGDPERTDVSRDLTYDRYNSADEDNTRGNGENDVGNIGGEPDQFRVAEGNDMDAEHTTSQPVTNSRDAGGNHKGRKSGGKGGDGGPSGGPGGGGPQSGQRTPRPQRKARKARRRARPANTNAAPRGTQPRNPH